MSFERHKLLNTTRRAGQSQDPTSRDMMRLRSRAAFAGVSALPRNIQEYLAVGQSRQGWERLVGSE